MDEIVHKCCMDYYENKYLNDTAIITDVQVTEFYCPTCERIISVKFMKDKVESFVVEYDDTETPPAPI
jgi:hypothetical protein